MAPTKKAIYKTGFCGNGLHEGTSPVGTTTGLPLKVCIFWIDCGCQCHIDLTELFEATGRERTPQQNPHYSPPKSTFVMPSVEPVVDTVNHTSPLGGLEFPPGTSVQLSLERPAAPPLPPPVAGSFGPTTSGRAARGELEAWVKGVTDVWLVESVLDPNWSVICTPPYIAKEISLYHGVSEPSTGAITSVLDRWTNLGFATIAKKPIRFISYTEEGTRLGLQALKDRAKRKPSKSAELERVTTRRK